MNDKPQEQNSSNEKMEKLKEMSKKTTEDAKEMANKAKDAAKEKLDEFKNMSAEERKAMAKNKMEDFKKMPLKNQLKYGAVAAAVLVVLSYLFSSNVHKSPDAVAEAACKAIKNKDYDAYAELFKPKDQKFMNADKGARELFDLYFKNRTVDCSYLKERKQRDDVIRFYPAIGDSIMVYLYRDGKWYVGL